MLHYPGKEKSTALFNKALKRKLAYRDFDFHGVWFPDKVSFKKVKFTSHARFASVTFTGEADFYDARFGDRANFIDATFEADANFSYAWFEGDADFGTYFRSLANFNYARFYKEAYFRGAEFHAKANFRSATFANHARFGGGGSFKEQSFLDFQFARIEKPELVSFDRLNLHPHWFANVDSRKFDFINVEWLGDLPGEIRALQAKEIYPSYDLLATACRRLAVNAEENHRYEEASRFRYMAMEAQRLDKPIENPVGFAPWTLHWWYWLASGYGERVWRAFATLAGIWLLSAAFYMGVGFVRWEPRLTTADDASKATRDTVGAPLSPQRALAYSAGVMTLQKPEPRPATYTAQTVVMLETILGPVQAALLALAIRRKFMR